MIVPDDTIREMIRDVSKLSREFAALIKNLQPRDGSDVSQLLESAKMVRKTLRNMGDTLLIVAEENLPKR